MQIAPSASLGCLWDFFMTDPHCFYTSGTILLYSLICINLGLFLVTLSFAVIRKVHNSQSRCLFFRRFRKPEQHVQIHVHCSIKNAGEGLKSYFLESNGKFTETKKLEIPPFRLGSFWPDTGWQHAEWSHFYQVSCQCLPSRLLGSLVKHFLGARSPRLQNPHTKEGTELYKCPTHWIIFYFLRGKYPKNGTSPLLFWPHFLIISPEITSPSGLPVGWHDKREFHYSREWLRLINVKVCTTLPRLETFCSIVACTEIPHGQVSHVWTSGTPWRY